MTTGRLGIDAAAWARLEPLLDAALDLPEPSRRAWLDRLPAGQQDLRPWLERLLAEPGSELPTHAALTGAGAGVGGPGRAAGERVGPYRLLDLLGCGGMGEVWRAERADGLMQREVALKLPHGGGLPGDLAARMARERNILAALVHTNIARLYDAGIGSDGQPYLALELVHGERIDLYAERHVLDVPARLRLVLQAARAVAYAHARLVVHRDLKPSNLLVDAEGQVKLLDFGIAKLLDREDEAGLTEQGSARPMTPGYASPEQVAGQPVGTRSDLYSLAVLAHELLSGASPYRPRHAGRAALEEAVLTQDPRPPSDAAGDPARRRALRGGIDTIVLHALQKSPEARYATVEAFADDIQRHLAHQPLLASRESRWVLLRKAVRRNALACAAGAVMLGGIVAGSALALWQARVAQAERLRAEQVKDFVADMLRDATPYRGRDVDKLSALDLVQQAEQRLAAATLPSAAVRTELGTLIGESLLTFGDLEGADRAVKRVAQGALAELDPADPLALRARMLEAQILRLQGQTGRQRAELTALLPLAQRQVGLDATLPVMALQHLAMNAVDRGAYAEAREHALQARALAMERLGERHPETVASTTALCMAQRYAAPGEEARRACADALRQAQAAYPGRSPPHLRVIEAQAVYGRVLGDLGETAAGVAQIESALQGALASVGAESPMVGMLRQNLVGYQLALGRLPEAVANGREALRVLALHAGPGTLHTAAAAAALGQALLAQRQLEEALVLLGPAAATLAQRLGPGNDSALSAALSAAQAESLTGRQAAARERLAALAPELAASTVKPATRQRAAALRAELARTAPP